MFLRDLQLSFKGLQAQIDFIILTPRGHLVVECKNMIGDIEINSNGDFIRKYTYGRKTIKNGIYSPITQNRRHLDLLRDIFKDRQENFILRSILDNEFLKMFTPIVVVANSKSVLNIKYTKKEVKEKIIRLDQLNNKIREILNSTDKMGYSCDELLKDANHIMNYHRVKQYDFKEKYKNYIKSENIGVVVKEPEVKVLVESVDESIESSPMYQALKKYRLEQSRKENVKPYFLFNNLQLEALVKSAPKNREELMKVNGFGTVKCDKYGEEILNIIHKFK